MQILAAGIETRHARNFLRSIGCDEGQGCLFGEPAALTRSSNAARQANSAKLPGGRFKPKDGRNLASRAFTPPLIKAKFGLP